MRNQAGIKKYAVEKNSSPEHPSGPQKREKPNLSSLDSPLPKKKQKPKKIKWIRGEYRQVIIAFYQALNEPKKKKTQNAPMKFGEKNTDHILMQITSKC